MKVLKPTRPKTTSGLSFISNLIEGIKDIIMPGSREARILQAHISLATAMVDNAINKVEALSDYLERHSHEMTDEMKQEVHKTVLAIIQSTHMAQIKKFGNGF